MFDFPVTVSMIKLWNYGKTSSRGVKEFEVSVYNIDLFSFLAVTAEENVIMQETGEILYCVHISYVARLNNECAEKFPVALEGCYVFME